MSIAIPMLWEGRWRILGVCGGVFVGGVLVGERVALRMGWVWRARETAFMMKGR